MPEIEKYGDVTFFKALNTNMGAHINVYLYLLDGILFDCGPEIMEADIAPFLREYKPREIILTHMHEDHCGMAAWVERNMGIPIYVDAGDIEAASRDDEYAEYRLLTWGSRPAFRALPLTDVHKGEGVSLRKINTPGHTPHHCVLFEENRGWLFSGDLYIRRHPRFAAPEENMRELISSIETVLELPFNTVFCAHAGIMEDGRGKLTEKLDYLRELSEKVEVMRRRGMTDEEIDGELFPDDPIITTVSGGEWTSLNMIKTL